MAATETATATATAAPVAAHYADNLWCPSVKDAAGQANLPREEQINK